MPRNITRRNLLLASSALIATSTLVPALASPDLVDGKNLKPGQWQWFPERALHGPVAIIVSLSDQLCVVYRNGIRIGVSTVSSGKKGYKTPTGVFSIYRKERMHHSSKYNNAAMPDSQFFMGGAALHAGGLPGYPSSHGCVHLPRAFADRLFQVTHNGTPVIVTDTHFGTHSLSHAGLVMTNYDLKQIEKLNGKTDAGSLPYDSKGNSRAAFSVVASGADRRIMGFVNGEEIFSGPIRIVGGSEPLGEHVFVLKGADDGGDSLSWVAVGLGTDHKEKVYSHGEFAAASRLDVSEDIQAKIADHMHAGMTFVITDLPAHPDTRTGRDFVVMRVGGTA